MKRTFAAILAAILTLTTLAGCAEDEPVRDHDDDDDASVSDNFGGLFNDNADDNDDENDETIDIALPVSPVETIEAAVTTTAATTTTATSAVTEPDEIETAEADNTPRKLTAAEIEAWDNPEIPVIAAPEDTTDYSYIQSYVDLAPVIADKLSTATSFVLDCKITGYDGDLAIYERHPETTTFRYIVSETDGYFTVTHEGGVNYGEYLADINAYYDGLRAEMGEEAYNTWLYTPSADHNYTSTGTFLAEPVTITSYVSGTDLIVRDGADIVAYDTTDTTLKINTPNYFGNIYNGETNLGIVQTVLNSIGMTSIFKNNDYKSDTLKNASTLSRQDNGDMIVKFVANESYIHAGLDIIGLNVIPECEATELYRGDLYRDIEGNDNMDVEYRNAFIGSRFLSERADGGVFKNITITFDKNCNLKSIVADAFSDYHIEMTFSHWNAVGNMIIPRYDS